MFDERYYMRSFSFFFQNFDCHFFASRKKKCSSDVAESSLSYFIKKLIEFILIFVFVLKLDLRIEIVEHSIKYLFSFFSAHASHQFCCEPQVFHIWLKFSIMHLESSVVLISMNPISFRRSPWWVVWRDITRIIKRLVWSWRGLHNLCSCVLKLLFDCFF